MSPVPADGHFELSPVHWVREQAERILQTGTTASVDNDGRAVVLMTVRGARTGLVRKVVLLRVENDGRYGVVASMGGAPRHPAWYHNVKAQSVVQLQDGTRTATFHARELSGTERDTWWARAVDTFADYAEYQAKTEREFPVFVLEPPV